MFSSWLLLFLFVALFGQSRSAASESSDLGCPVFRSQDFRRARDEIVNPIKQSILSSLSGDPQSGVSIEWNHESCILAQTEDVYSQLERSKKRSKGATWQCQICHKTFRSEYHVDKHLVTKHPELVFSHEDHGPGGDHDHGGFCAGHWCGKILPCGPAPERELFGNVAVSMNASYLKSVLQWCYSAEERKARESECMKQVTPCISIKRDVSCGEQDTFAYDVALKKLAVLCEESVHDECSNLRRPLRELAHSSVRAEVLSSYRLPQYDKIEVSELESKAKRHRHMYWSGGMDDASGGQTRWRFVLGILFSVGLAVFYILARVVSGLRATAPDLTRRVDGESARGRPDRHQPIGAGAMQRRKGQLFMRALDDLQHWWIQTFRSAARKKKEY